MIDYKDIMELQSPFALEAGIVIEPVADSGPMSVFLLHTGNIVNVEHFYFPTYNKGSGSSNLPEEGTTVLIGWLPGKTPCYMGCMTMVSYPVQGEPANTTESVGGDTSRLPQENGENKTIGPKQQLLKFDNYGNFALTDSSLSGILSNKDYGGLLLQAMQLITSTDAEASFSGVWKSEDEDTEEIVNSLKPKKSEDAPQNYYTTKNSTLYSVSSDVPTSRSYYKRLAEAILETDSFRNLTLTTKDDELEEKTKTRPIIYKAEVNDINSKTKLPRKNIAIEKTWDTSTDPSAKDRKKAIESNSLESLSKTDQEIVTRRVIFSESTREARQVIDTDKDGNVFLNVQGALDLVADQRHTEGKFKRVNLVINQGLIEAVTNGINIQVAGELTDQEKAEKEAKGESTEPSAAEVHSMNARGYINIECSGVANIKAKVIYLNSD